IPPLATARTTARDVQLARVPVPTQRSGCDVSTGPASGGTSTAAAAPGAATSAPAMATDSASGRDNARRAYRPLPEREPDERRIVVGLLVGELRVDVHGPEPRPREQGRRREQDVVEHLAVALEDVAVALALGHQVPEVDELRQAALIRTELERLQRVREVEVV